MEPEVKDSGQGEGVIEAKSLIGGSPNLNVIHSVDSESSFEDLVPESLKAAYKKMEQEEFKKAPQKEDVKVKEGEGEKTTEEEPQVKPEEKKKISAKTESDITSDDVDKLLKGELEDDTIADDKTSEETPAWGENAVYKEMVNNLSSLGLKKEQVDGFIREILDKEVVDKSTLVQGLETKIEEHKTAEDAYKAEIARLREIEKGVKFDHLEDIKTKYHQPKAAITENIQRLLDLEGIDIPLNKILNAKNRTEFTDLISNVNFDDPQVQTQLTNYWRSYQTINHEYSKDKENAEKNIGNFLSHKVTKETADNMFKGALGDILKADERYGYLNQAVKEGFAKHPQASEVIATSKKNLYNLLNAMADPAAVVNDPKWLKGMALFMIDAAHKTKVEGEFAALSKKYAEKSQSLVKLFEAHKELLASAKGINGTKGLSNGNHSKNNGAAKLEGNEAETLNKFLHGKIDLDDLMPTFK